MPKVQRRWVDEHVGNRMKQHREELGLTRRAVAAALHISPPQYGKYETGRNQMSATHLYDASRVLNVPVGYFFEGLEVKV